VSVAPLQKIAPGILTEFAGSTAAGAADFEIRMLNKGASGAMVFEPNFVKAAVGDTVYLVAAAKDHNAETAAGMLRTVCKPSRQGPPGRYSDRDRGDLWRQMRAA
jgi:plastocyanin